MVYKKRCSTTGKFEITPVKNENDEEISENSWIHKKWINKIFIALAVIVLLSPWLFLISKRNSLTDISKKITDFYDTNFSCNVSFEINSEAKKDPAPSNTSGF
jgi:hypothetical protein